MALHDFYELIKYEVIDEGCKAMVHLNPNHEIYTGHFPGRPVVPGVCLLHILKELCSKRVGSKLEISTAASIKYLQVIDPNDSAEIEWNLSIIPKEDSGFTVRCSAFWKQRVCFKFVGTFQ